MKRVVCFMMSFLLLVMSVPMEGLAGSVSGNEGVEESAGAEVENISREDGVDDVDTQTEEIAGDMTSDINSESLEQSGTSTISNPVHHCTGLNDGTDYTDWSYVYFGSYPQSEVTDTSITSAIDNTILAGNGTTADVGVDVWLNGTKYRRINADDTNDDNRYFGNNTYRYFKWERIKWRVLNNNGDTLFLVADKAMDCKDYNDELTAITWEKSTIRSWLNDIFYHTAFNSSEKNVIVTQNVANEDNPKYGTDGGNNTADKVYLLSLNELMNTKYGFCSEYNRFCVSRQLQTSAYVNVRGVVRSIEGNCGWWLRSTGHQENNALVCGNDGTISISGGSVDYSDFGVVPALHINLLSDIWSMTDDGTSGAGGEDEFEEEVNYKYPTIGNKAQKDGHAYQLFEVESDNWKTVETYLESIGGHLATITSAEEDSFVYNYMKDCGITGAYFGLTDYEEEGVWKWVTGECYSYSNWASGEPNNQGGYEHYGLYYYKSGEKWNDGSGTSGIYICEWDDTDSTTDSSEAVTLATEWVNSRGCMNAILYSCKDENFTNSTYVYSNDACLPGQLESVLGNMVFRGSDGWKNLFFSSTAIEEAEKILVGLMQEYELDVTELSEAKAAQELAGIWSSGLKEYLRVAEINDEDIQKLADTLGENEIANMLIKGDFDKISEKIDESTCSNKSELKSLLAEYNKSEELAGGLSKGLKLFGYGTKAIDLTVASFEKIYELDCLYKSNEMYKEMLQYLKDNCYYSVVQKAASNALEIIEQGPDKKMEIVLLTIGGEVALDGIEWVVQWLGDKGTNWIASHGSSLMTKYCLYLAAIETGWNLGTNICNSLFHTGDTVQLKDSMRTCAYISNCLSRWTVENFNGFVNATSAEEKEKYAKKFVYSVSMLNKSRKVGEETFQSMRETSYTSWKEDYNVSCMITKTLDSHRNTLFSGATKELKTSLGISCPVNVQVFDRDNNLLVTLYDGKETEGTIGEVDYSVKYNPLDDDYMKFVILPENSGYYVKAIGLDLGKVDGIISTIDEEGDSEISKFTDVMIDKNTSILIENLSTGDEKQYTVENKGKSDKYFFEKSVQETIHVDSIVLKNVPTEIQKGTRINLSCDIFPTDATCKKIVWSSSNAEIATVNNDGVITALKEGEVTITATSDDGANIVSACKIKIKDDNNNVTSNEQKTAEDTGKEVTYGNEQPWIMVKKLKITAPSKKLAAGKKVKLSIKVTPSNATNSAVTWQTSNTKYATIDQNGKLTLKKAGIGKSVNVTATAADGSGVKATYKIKIMKHAVKRIKLSATSKSVTAGKSIKLKATIKTTGKSVNKKLKWTSSNTKYATVTKSGKVKTKKAGKGKTVKITAQATDGTGKKASIKIKIK